jgi:hypothetical protein
MHAEFTRRPQVRSAVGSFALGVAIVAATGALAFGARQADAQPPSTRPASQTMLRRLAEVVDGYRTGSTIYIVMSYDFPHTVHGIFERPDSARDRTRSDATLGMFGPYVTIRDNSPFFIGCKHDHSGSNMSATEPICPPESLRKFPLTDVESISVIVHLRGGRTETVPIGPGADALFFTTAALDKFVFPYYAKVFGAERVTALRTDFLSRLGRP